MERRIDPSRWVAAIINRLSPDVRTRFREHFSDRAEARAWTMIPFAMVHRRTHPADSADWEDFWRWLLRTYLRPAHQDAAHRRWQAMEHHRSTATSLMADTGAFNEALLHADLMEHVLRRDEAWLESPEIADTYERRRVYRAMLPEDIQLHVTQQEAHAARQAASEARCRWSFNVQPGKFWEVTGPFVMFTTGDSGDFTENFQKRHPFWGLHRKTPCRRRTRPRRVWRTPCRHRRATRNEHDRVGKEEGNPVRAERAWAHQRRLHGVPKSPCAALRGGDRVGGSPPGGTCRRPNSRHGAAGRERDS